MNDDLPASPSYPPGVARAAPPFAPLSETSNGAPNAAHREIPLPERRVQPLAQRAPAALPPARHRARVLSALAAGALVFVAVILGAGIRFQSQTVLRVHEGLASDEVAKLEKSLAQALAEAPEDDHAAASLTYGGAAFSFSALGTTPGRSRANAEKLAERCVALGSETVRALLESPSEAEAILRDTLARRVTAQQQMSALTAAAPQNDPRTKLDDLLRQWRDARSRVQDAKELLTAAQTRFNDLESSGMPQSAEAPASLREQMKMQDVGLQQDLRELEVNLAELRVEVSGVIDRAGSKLEETKEAAIDLAYETRTAEPQEPRFQKELPDITATAAAYTTSLDEFASAWTSRSALLAALTEPSRRLEIIALGEDLAKLARDFLYTAEKHLEELQKSSRRWSEDLAMASRNRDAVAMLTRGVQRLATAHRRLAFDITSIDAAENFRIDAALRGARGLDSRCRARMQAIDDRLNAAALEEARQAWTADHEQSRIALASARSTYDQASADLLPIYESVVEVAKQTPEFVELATRAELGRQLVGIEKAEIDRLEKLLEPLAGKRNILGDRPPLTLVSVTTDKLPIGFRTHLLPACISATAAFILMLLIQLRPTRHATD